MTNLKAIARFASSAAESYLRRCFVLEAQEVKAESTIIAVPPIKLVLEKLDSDLDLANFEALDKRSVLVQGSDFMD